MLRPADQAALDRLGLTYNAVADGGFVAVTVGSWPLPAGLSATTVDLLVRLPPGFPDAGPDMFWLSPAITTATGGVIAGTEAAEDFLGRHWQRWSRHISGDWRPGIDNLATYLAYVRRCLDHAAGRAA